MVATATIPFSPSLEDRRSNLDDLTRQVIALMRDRSEASILLLNDLINAATELGAATHREDLIWEIGLAKAMGGQR